MSWRGAAERKLRHGDHPMLSMCTAGAIVQLQGIPIIRYLYGCGSVRLCFGGTILEI